MDLTQLANLGEFVGGVAVVVTLIYLAFQVRQSTSLARATEERELMEAVQRIQERIVRHPEVWQRGLASFEALSRPDQLRFSVMINPFVNVLERTLRMRSRGLLTRDNVDVYGDICLAVVAEPGARTVWEGTKPLYFTMSRDYIQRRLDDQNDPAIRISELMPWHLPERKNDA